MRSNFPWLFSESMNRILARTDFLKIAFSAHVNVNSRSQRKRGKIRHLSGRDVRGILED